MINKNIVFFGGDKRQLFAASALSEVYREVRLLGFDMLISEGRLIIDNDVGCLGNADLVVMPIVGVKNGTVQTLFSDKEYKLNGETLPLLKDKLIAAGKGESFESFGLRVYDLLKREDFTLKNAYLTAEGAVSVAMDSYEGSIANAKILVIGYGRIGKYLSRMLRALGASVTVSSRSEIKRAEIYCDGNRAVSTSELLSISDYDIVFNTADAVILDEKLLENSDSLTLIIDLASGKGGTDFAAAEKLGFCAVHALGLPGKCSPKTAGEIIADTILTIPEEEYAWQRRI